MLNDILSGVNAKLKELFGEDTVIYTDAVEQGLVEPCFFVGFLEPSEKTVIGRRRFRSTGIYIQYLPGSPAQINRELYRVADILMDGMESITLKNGDILRGTGISSKASEGVLNFFVNYNMFIIKPAGQSPDMGEIETEVRKEGESHGTE